MEYYIFYSLFLLLSFFDLFEKRFSVKSPFYLVILLALSFFIGFRERGIGGDFVDYERLYNNILTQPMGLYEPGYYYLNKLFSSFFMFDFHVFLFFYTLTYLFLMFKSFPKYAYPFIALLIFYSNYLLVTMVNTRQILALSICFFSIRYILKNKFLIFFILVFLSSLFHRSALIFLFAYFLNGNKIKIKLFLMYFTMVVLYLVLPFVGDIPLLLSSTFYSKIIAYLSTNNSTIAFVNVPDFAGLILLKRITVLVFIYFFLSNIKSKNIILFKRCYFASVMIFLIFFSTIPIIATRGAIYFQIFEIILLPLALKYNPKYKFLIFTFIIIYSIQNIISSVNDLHGHYVIWNFNLF